MHNSPFLTALVSIGLTGAVAAYVILDQQIGGETVWIAFTIVLGVALAGCILLNSRRPNDRCVVLQGDELLIPLPSGFGRRARSVDFGELRSVELTRSPRGAELKLNIRGHGPASLSRKHLSCGDLERFHESLFASASATNPQLLAARRLFQRRNRVPWVSALTSLIIALVFLVCGWDDDDPVHRLIVVGGLNDWLISYGETYRLAAAALLHADLGHLLINTCLLLIIGLRLEYVTGALHFAGALVTGMLTGNLTAYLVGGQTVVIGASGGIFGLLALYACTLYTRRHHLPTRTQFAHNTYLMVGLAILFLPLPGYAQSAHVGGFIGGLLHALLSSYLARSALTALTIGGGAFIVVSGWYGLAQAGAWETREPRLIEQMARDPSAGMGTLDLVGWYALQHQEPNLMRIARQRLEELREPNASAAATLAELLLEQGEPHAAARWANNSFELDGDREARELLMRAELAAYAASCAPADYSGEPVERPIPVVGQGQLTFVSSRPLYVHARVNHHYVMAPTDVPIDTVIRGTEAVTLLGYGDRLPLRRKPRVLRIPAPAVDQRCEAKGPPAS